MSSTINDTDKRIFFFDLDGTLLTTDKRVSRATYDALKRFTGAGHHIAINTGRGLESTYSVWRSQELGFPGSYLCCSNGSEIYDCDAGTDIYRTYVPFDLTVSICELAREHGIHIHAYEAQPPTAGHIPTEYLITPDEDEAFVYYRRVVKTPYRVAPGITSALSAPSCKLLAIELHDSGRLERFRREATALAGDRLTLIYSNPYYLEIFDSSAGKGSAVGRLCEHLHIDVSHSLAAGDEENDISMLEASGTGIAMANATASVKAAADIITATDNDHDGLVPYIINDSFYHI